LRILVVAQGRVLSHSISYDTQWSGVTTSQPDTFQDLMPTRSASLTRTGARHPLLNEVATAVSVFRTSSERTLTSPRPSRHDAGSRQCRESRATRRHNDRSTSRAEPPRGGALALPLASYSSRRRCRNLERLATSSGVPSPEHCVEYGSSHRGRDGSLRHYRHVDCILR